MNSKNFKIDNDVFKNELEMNIEDWLKENPQSTKEYYIELLISDLDAHA